MKYPSLRYAWIKTSQKDGRKFMSLSVKGKDGPAKRDLDIPF